MTDAYETAISDYIANVELGLDRPFDISLAEAELPPLTAKVKQAAVVDSDIVTYPENVPLEARTAVANWTLLAQRAADHAVPDSEDREAWSRAYSDCSIKTGWTLREQAAAWREEKIYGSTVHKEILKLLPVIPGPASTALAIATVALTSLAKMDNESPWITLLNRRGREAKSGGFQIANCTPGTTGRAVLEGADFVVYAERRMTQVLFFKFESNTAKMGARRVSHELSGNVIADHGKAVTDRVHKFVGDSIAAIEID